MKLHSVSPLAVLFFSAVLAILGFLLFHIKFRICLSISHIDFLKFTTILPLRYGKDHLIYSLIDELSEALGS